MGKVWTFLPTLNLGCIQPWQMLCPLMIPNQLACVSASASGVHLGGLDLGHKYFDGKLCLILRIFLEMTCLKGCSTKKQPLLREDLLDAPPGRQIPPPENQHDSLENPPFEDVLPVSFQ